MMNDATFQSLARRAKLLTGEYGAGYQRGLRRHYHGEAFGTTEEHELWSRLGLDGDLREEQGRGYRDGLAGLVPKPLIGRPLLAANSTRSDKRTRSVRLSEAHWAQLQELGTEWLEHALDRARESGE